MRRVARFLSRLVSLVWLSATLVDVAQAQSPAPGHVAGTVHAAALWFDATASLGAFRGTTHNARGEMRGGPALTDVRGFVEAQATSLSTDNSLRDHDMRKTLEVGKYATIRFDLDSVAVLADSGAVARVELVGRMAIHGVTRHIRVPATVKREAATIRVTGAFDVKLPDYGITNLKRMLGALTMNEMIRVGLDVTFTTTTHAREGLEAAA
jgi:polyisoprenoid-binding protein YceI